MRPLILVPLVVAAVATSTPPADAGTYAVSWHGADLHGRLGGLGQFAAGNYRVAERATGVSIETAPGTAIAPGGFAVDSLAAPGGSRFAAVTVSTMLCSGAAGVYASVLAPEQPVVLHDHASSYCSWRTTSANVDTPMLSLVLGASNRGASSSVGSQAELQALDARIVDDAPPSGVAASSPSAGGVVGTPSVELRWTGTDALSGVAAVYVVNEAGAGLGEIAGLPAPDLRLAVAQRTGGSPTASGTARVALPHAGESLLRARVVDGAGNWVDSAPVRVTYVEPPRPLAVPRVKGTPTPGGALACDGGEWASPAPSLAYAWLRDGVDIAGATGPRYAVSASDVGHRLECRVRASNAGTAAGGPPTVTTSEAVAVASSPRPVVLAAPELRGTLRQGIAIACDPGQWGDPQPDLAVAWRRDGIVVAGGATYVPTVDDVGRDLDCRVTATGGGNPPGQTVVTTAPARVAPAAGAGLHVQAYAGRDALDPVRPSTVAAGAMLHVVGRVQAAPGADAVVVETRFPGLPTERRTARLEPTGHFDVKFRAARGGELVVRYAGDAQTAPVEAPAAQLRVRPAVTATFRARRAGTGAVRSLSVQGRVTPAPGVPVRLAWQGQPQGRGAWQALCRGAGITVRADGRFSGSCGLAGRFFAANRYRVTLPAAPLGPYAGAVSAPRRATVRR